MIKIKRIGSRFLIMWATGHKIVENWDDVINSIDKLEREGVLA